MSIDEEVVLFNDTPTHFIYGHTALHMVKGQTTKKRRNLLPPLHGLFFLISDLLYVPSPHTIAFVTSVVEHWLEREIARGLTVQLVCPLALLNLVPRIAQITVYKQ